MNQILDTNRKVWGNGLRLLTHPLPESEVVALHFCVQAGYFLEKDSEVGLAHLLEHMYFKGSAHFPVPGTIGIRMKALGGIINASTSYDQTNYYCAVPAENLFSALEIMTDAFLDPLFPDDELRRECEVVIEEFNRKIDSPSAYSIEKLIQLAYTTHRMKRWRIGAPEQLRTYTRDHLFNYFHKYYQPSNMIVTVAGKFDETAVLEKIENSLGLWKGTQIVKDFGPAEPRQTTLRHETCRAEATQSYLHFGFHAPGVLSDESPAIEFLCFLLSNGKSSRLHRFLVEQKRSASSASFNYSAYENIGLVTLSAVTEASQIRSAGQDAWTCLTDLRTHGVSLEEMEKVKNKLRLFRATQTEEVLNLAQLLGYYEAYGGFEKIEEIQNGMETLEEEQILSVAEKYLGTENLSVLEFVNNEVPPIVSDSYEKQLFAFPPTPEAAFPPPIVVEKVKLGSFVQNNPLVIRQGKITYIVQSDPRYSQISAGLYFLGGRNQEADFNAGITHLLFRTLLKGTSRWNAEQIAFRFDSLGNPPRLNCSRDYAGYAFETLPEYFMEAWNLLIHCIYDARFPEHEIQSEKRKVTAAIRRAQDDTLQRPLQLFQRAFYGAHPYGLPETGTEESLGAIQQTDLKNWAEGIFVADRAIAVVVGDFDSNDLISALESTLKDLPLAKFERATPAAVSIPVHREQAETRMKKQTAFFLGFPAPWASSKEIHQYSVLQQVLSGMGGRLFQNLRSKKSLAYSISAGLFANLYGGTFLTYIAGNAAKEKEAMKGMWEELEELKEHGIRPEELENAIQALIGTYALGTQTAASRVQDYFSSYILGRPIPFSHHYRELLKTIQAGDIQKIARETFVREHSALGIVRGTTQQTAAEKLILV